MHSLPSRFEIGAWHLIDNGKLWHIGPLLEASSQTSWSNGDVEFKWQSTHSINRVSNCNEAKKVEQWKRWNNRPWPMRRLRWRHRPASNKMMRHYCNGMRIPYANECSMQIWEPWSTWSYLLLVAKPPLTVEFSIPFMVVAVVIIVSTVSGSFVASHLHLICIFRQKLQCLLNLIRSNLLDGMTQSYQIDY